MFAACCAGYALVAALVLGPTEISLEMLGSSIVLGTFLSALTMIDIATLRLPDQLTLPLISFGIVASYLLNPDQVLLRVAAAAVGFLSFYFVATTYLRIRGIDALGLGDAKLLAAAGAWVGFDGLPCALLIASVSALVVVGAAMVSGAQITRETRVPFGPFLAGGIWIEWIFWRGWLPAS